MRSIGRSTRHSHGAGAELLYPQVPNGIARPVRVRRRDDGTTLDVEPVDARELIATGEYTADADEAGAA